MKNIVILVSGRGSNMVAIAQALQRQQWPARIAAVIGSRPGAPALEAAAGLGLPVQTLDPKSFADRSGFDRELAALIESHSPELVVLAGFMRILSDDFVDRFAGRLVNIHPSLLPAFPGLHPHRQALQAGVKVHGATVHLVTRELDSGPIIAQALVPVLSGDNEESLADRVLALEHQIYPQAVRWLLEGRLSFGADGAWLKDPAGATQVLVGPGLSGAAHESSNWSVNE